MFDTRHVIVERHSFEVPVRPAVNTDLDDLYSSHHIDSHSRAETYEFDGDLLVVQQICSLEKNAKGTLSYFLADPIMDTNDIRR